MKFFKDIFRENKTVEDTPVKVDIKKDDVKQEGWECSAEIIRAQKNWGKFGHFGVTSEDHKALGSSPDPRLLLKPGETRLIDVIDGRELDELIEGKLELISIQRDEESQEKKKNELMTDFEFLKSIGRYKDEYDEIKNMIDLIPLSEEWNDLD